MTLRRICFLKYFGFNRREIILIDIGDVRTDVLICFGRLHFKCCYHVLLQEMSLRNVKCWRSPVTKWVRKVYHHVPHCNNILFVCTVFMQCNMMLDTAGPEPPHWYIKMLCCTPSCEYLGTCHLVLAAYLHLSVLCGWLPLPGRLMVDILWRR